MITSIKLRGFQSHVDTQIDLTNGLNIITGPSDSGKTSIIRALRWLALGEPSGDSFVNTAVGFTQVEVRTEDHYIVKTRKGNKTSYDIDGNLYEKAEVPEEVAEILGIKRISFGDFESVLQIAFQLDAPFLLSESPSAGAKVLGKLAHAEVVDHAIKKSAETIYEARRDKASAEKQLAEIAASLQQYENLPAVGAQLKKCEALLTSIESFQARVNALQRLKDSFQEVEEKKNTALEVLETLKNVPRLQERLDATEKFLFRKEVLVKLHTQHEQLQQKLTGYLELAGKTKNLQAAAEILKTVSAVIDTLRALRKLYSDYRNAITHRETLSERLSRLHDLVIAQEGIRRVEADSERLTALKQAKDSWVKAKDRLGETEVVAIVANANILSAERELETAWGEEKVCPLCEREVLN